MPSSSAIIIYFFHTKLNLHFIVENLKNIQAFTKTNIILRITHISRHSRGISAMPPLKFFSPTVKLCYTTHLLRSHELLVLQLRNRVLTAYDAFAN